MLRERRALPDPGFIARLSLIISLTLSLPSSVLAAQPTHSSAPTVGRRISPAPRPAVVRLGRLDQVYQGRPLSATCTTIPAGLQTVVAYGDRGHGTDRVNAGLYGVTCTVTQAGYTGSAGGTLTITRARQTIAFGYLARKTYGDAPFAVDATASSGLPVTFTSLTPDVCTIAANIVSLVGARICTIRASQAGSANYKPARTVDRSLPVGALVSLGALTHTYDGTPKSATCTTNPSGLATAITYRDLGSGTDRINAGSYGVICTVTEPRVKGRARGTLSIGKASQTISFGPLAAMTLSEPPFTVMGTASSGLPVSITSLTPETCSVASNTVTLTGVGTCTLQATQPGDMNRYPAEAVDQSFLVAAAPVPPPSDVHQVIAYDSALQGDWNLALWQDADHPVNTNVDAAAPGRSERAIEVQFGPNGWGAFGLANMKDWSNQRYMYLNEFRSLEFDIYFEPDSTGTENLQFVLEDAGYSSQPALVSYIPAWDPAHPESILAQWFHVNIDLTAVGATTPRFVRFLFWNGSGSGSQPHFLMANVRLGWVEDVTAPVVTLVSAMPSLTYDQLALNFTTDEPTTYRVDYGITDLATTIQGHPEGWGSNHTATLTGLSRGHTYQFRITAWNHHTDPSAAPTPGVFEGTYVMPPVPTAPPVISSFTAAPPSIGAGETSKLTWAVMDYESLSIDQGVGSVAQIPGAMGVFVSPHVTTDYTLAATNAVGTATMTVTITTHPVPVIHSFRAIPAKVGSGEASTLTWDIEFFDSISIDHGVGTATTIPGATGISVSPGDTTTYTLTAANAFGTVLQTATVTLDAGAQSPAWVMGYYVGYQSAVQPPDRVDYSAMTHVAIGAALPRADGTFDTSFFIDPVGGPAWACDTVNRAHAAGIKAILMIGGAGFVSGFRATSDPAVRAAFVNNLKLFVDGCGFDGVDLDWEPLENADRPVLVALTQALQAPGVMPRSQYIYTLPVGWNNANFNDMADPFYGTVSAYFDRLGIMSYSMVWFGDGWQSWHSSPLFGETPSTPSSIDNTVRALRAAGVPDGKINIGVGFYGTPYENGTWQGGTFVHANPPDIPAYVTAPHQSTDTAGARFFDHEASYSNIMRYMFSETAYRWDDTAKVPYLSFATPRIVNVPGVLSNLRTTYVTYDNEQSLAEKGSYVRTNGLGGLIIWTISEGYLGDWKTTGEVDPLMKSVKEALLE